jgi:hypothetical protein
VTTSQKLPKKAHELTTDEAVKHLFHPDVIAHAKDRVEEPDRVVPPKKKSIAKE